MSNKTRTLAALIATTFAVSANAAVSSEEAKQLNGPVLTAMGAEKAGNKDGTIPAYTGEGVKSPGPQDPKDPNKRPDPFANEKLLFSITAQNAAQYADKLGGMIGMFKKYPNFRMDVYPSHRTSAYPKQILDNTFKNATACKAVNNELKLDGCWGGFAFPIPKTGAQVMWNHLTAYRAQFWGGLTNSYVIPTSGSPIDVGTNNAWSKSEFFDFKATEPAKPNTVYWEIRVDSLTPARRVGEKLIVIDPLDVLGVGRRAYQYIPGQRRVKLAPDLSYDTPSPNAGGAATMDDAEVFLGALDRYDWKLVGKKEKYIMYNNFKLVDHGACSDAVVHGTKNFANPDCVRWELHRVWHVEATLKPGFRHIYHKRDFYWDEDSYAAGVAENYDAAGKLYRVVTAISYPFWTSEGGTILGDSTYNYDLQTGVYSVQGSIAEPGRFCKPQTPESAFYYSPEALAGAGIR